MRVAVLGAGVIGVTSAWYLAKAGHEVVVVDRQPGPGLETSFANAGEISPSYASPWAEPDVPLKAAKWLFMRHAPLIIRAGAIDFAMLRWLGAMLVNCGSSRHAVNRDRMMRLAVYSRQMLTALRAETQIAYDGQQLGTLQLCATQAELDARAADIDILASFGLRCEILDRAACIAAEPGLARSRANFAGGVRTPDDETGDCFRFTSALAELAKAQGVNFLHGRTIRRLEMEGHTVRHVDTDQGTLAADSFVVALGSHTPGMVRPLGIELPIYPVKGYSITADIVEPDRAPVSTLLDGELKVALTRLGNRIRVGGLAELAGFAGDRSPRRRATLALALDRLFPGASDVENAAFWSGFRPMTPDSTPIVGGTALSNLYINAGHGTLGWTMACGSARVIADIISGIPPEIQAADLSAARYG